MPLSSLIHTAVNYTHLCMQHFCGKCLMKTFAIKLSDPCELIFLLGRNASLFEILIFKCLPQSSILCNSAFDHKNDFLKSMLFWNDPGKETNLSVLFLFLEPSNIGNNGNHPRLLWSQPLCYLRTTPVVYALKLMWWLSSRQSLYTTNFFIFSNCLHKLRLSRRVAIMKITIDF